MTTSSSRWSQAPPAGARRSLRLAVALLLGVTSCAASARQDDAWSIRAALIAWMDDFNAGRADQVCGLFAPTLRFDFRGTPERGYADLCAQRPICALANPAQRFSYMVTINEVLVSGDLAIVRLVWHSTVRAGASNPVITDEPGLDVFARQPDISRKLSASATTSPVISFYVMRLLGDRLPTSYRARQRDIGGAEVRSAEQHRRRPDRRSSRDTSLLSR